MLARYFDIDGLEGGYRFRMRADDTGDSRTPRGSRLTLGPRLSAGLCRRPPHARLHFTVARTASRHVTAMAQPMGHFRNIH